MTRLPRHHRNRAADVIIRFSLASLVFFLSFGASAQWLTGWDYRKEIVLDGAQIAGGGTHTDFPVLISLMDSDLAARALSNGHDIVFTSSNGTSELEHELESYTSGTGALAAWVKLDVTASVDITIYMYYGNSGATDPDGDDEDTWDSDYLMVYHMDGTEDVTANSNDLTTPGGGNDPATITDSKAGVAMDFDGNDYFSTGNSTLPATYTIEAWAKGDAAPNGSNDAPIVQNLYAYTITWNHGGWPGGTYFKSLPDDSWDGVAATPALSGSTWYHMAAVFDGNSLDLYINGTNVASTSAFTTPATTQLHPTDQTTFIAKHAQNAHYFNGIIDEVRISTIARSGDYIQTSYNNQNTPGVGGFIKTLGAQEEPCPSAGTASADTTTPPYDGTSNLSLTGFIPGNLGIQWEESTDNVTFSPIGGATSDLYTETNVTATKYFRATVDYDSCIATSNVVTIFAETQFDTDYCKRKLITIDNSRVSGTSNLTDFPLYFSTTDNDLRTVANGGFVESAQGWDIVFTADDGVTELDHEIDSYDGSTGTYKGWIRIPSLSYNADTEIYMYFGNSSASDPDANDELVWDADYAGVFHLNNDFLDATSNNRDGTNSGTDNFASTPLSAGRDLQDQTDRVTTG
ncbi:MAG: DUF2341 domain-containing protein, partial [Bacteroidota bacterium]